MIDKNNQLQEMVLDTGGRCWYPNKRVQQVHTADEWSRRDRALKSAAPKEQCHTLSGSRDWIGTKIWKALRCAGGATGRGATSAGNLSGYQYRGVTRICCALFFIL